MWMMALFFYIATISMLAWWSIVSPTGEALQSPEGDCG